MKPAWVWGGDEYDGQKRFIAGRIEPLENDRRKIVWIRAKECKVQKGK